MKGHIRTQDLTFEYDEQAHFSLNQINLQLEVGQITALLGPSGSGKSTLLRLLAGLWAPYAGEVLLGDESISAYAHELIPGHPEIIMVHQDYQLPAHQPLVDSFRWPLRYEEEAAQQREIQHLATLMGLTPFLLRKPKSLSGGQQQRAAIILGLLEKPRWLLLDEPFSNLDMERKIQLRKELARRCQSDGLSLVFTTHDPEDALTLANHVAILDEGHLAQQGPPVEVYRNPSSIRAGGLLGYFSLLNSNAFPELPIEKQVFLRPTDVSIDPKGPHIGEVIQFNFLGMTYLITLRAFENQTLLCASPLPHPPGQKVRFHINLAQASFFPS